jgi:hypothetical protein
MRCSQGKKYFTVANMGTTMFGSVDDPSVYTDWFSKNQQPFFLHVDAAYGGLCIRSWLQKIHSILAIRTFPRLLWMRTNPAPRYRHFLCRKGPSDHVLTKEAQYVEGMDLTLSGSRSGV